MTIKDIAKEAGVSTAAVSRYFNGGSLGEEKRECIRKVVQKHGFTPNQSASSMRTGKSNEIGVIVPKIHSDSLSQLIHGIATGLSEKDYTMIVGCAEGDTDREVHYIKTMENNGMEGIILMGTVMTPYLMDTIKSCSVPVVVTGQSFAGVPCVYYDDKNAMRELAAMMLKKRKHIVYIGAIEEDVAVGKNRRLGAMKAFEDAGRDPKEMVFAVSGFEIEDGYEAMKKILAKHKKTDGVLCATDSMALGAMLALRDAGKRIPEDVSVAGIGNNRSGMVTTPQLTTVRLFFEQCGETAVRLLSEMIAAEGKSIPISQIRLGYEVIERGSI